MKDILNRILMGFVFIIALPVVLLMGAVGALNGLRKTLFCKDS
jgi:hypothetical protein